MRGPYTDGYVREVRSTTSILGHSIHPMLVSFAIAFLIGFAVR